MRSLTASLWLLATVKSAECMTMVSTGRPGYGLLGYGITMFQPLCPFACRNVLSSAALECSETTMMDGAPMVSTTADCYAMDDGFMTSLAYCIHQRCSTLEAWEIEKWWQSDEPGTAAMQPSPSMTYQDALAMVSQAPNMTLMSGDALNMTVATDDASYEEYVATLGVFERVEDNHETYGIVLAVTGFVIPIAASLLRFVPFPRLLISEFNAIFVDPPLFGHRHKVPYFNLAVMPTRGQAFFLAYLVVINVVLSAAGYESAKPNAWYTNQNREILTYVTNRLGVLSFANIPLFILYAGRNNILYWVTNWSQSTFMLLHRWVAYIATLQAILHSLIYLRIYVHLGTHNTEAQLPYWYWGIIATLCMSILIPLSIIPIRQKVYELFLASHVFLSILTLVGCYYHIYARFEHQWGYELWIYTAVAVWGFDRVMRLLRIMRNDSRTAIVTIIDEEHVRVDIAGVASNGHAYLYFPTLTWRVWENHPFSVATSIVKTAASKSALPASEFDVETSSADSIEVIKHANATVSPQFISGNSRNDPTLGLTFLLRTHKGSTALLHKRRELPVLIESDYSPPEDLTHYPTLICIVGGVGITAVLPHLRAHPGRAKLYWSSRSANLVRATETMLEGVDKDVLTGSRHDLRAVLDREAGSGFEEMVVVVSGPARMADEVRCLVSEMSKGLKRPIRLVEESFTW